MKNIKISIIGAGSGCFSLGIIRDLCLTKNLQGSTISFMDIDEGRLNAVYNLCCRYSEEMGVNLTLEKTTDRKASLKGADFVINTALAASHTRLKEGWKVALKHGYRFPGSYHIMYDEAFWINFYQLRLMESITQDILDICPDAWHLMVANPVVAGTTFLTRKYPKSKLVGLCHGYAEVYKIAENLGLGREGLNFQISGVNHFVWLTHLYHQGTDMLPVLSESVKDSTDSRHVLYKQFGVHPIGDTAGWTGALWPWWNNVDKMHIDFWKDDPDDFTNGWDSYFNMVNKQAEDIKKHSSDLSIKVTEIYPPNKDDELMIPLIESLACDIPRVFILNVQNTNEFVPGIPRDFEVEIPALASKRGVQGMKTNGLPKQVLLHTLRDRVIPVEMELEAYETGSRDLLLQLIFMDKSTGSTRQAKDFLDEILLLPYHKEMKEHYK